MLPELLRSVSLFSLLHRIDIELANKHQKSGCRYCGGPLHYATYQRKPRGGPPGIPNECLVRLSLCCSRPDCRRRTLPPSVLFMGRRVYWKAVILIVVILRSGVRSSMSKSKLKQLFDVDAQTVSRWVAYFRDEFPATPSWQRIRGRICSVVKESDLPGGLFHYFLSHSPTAEQAMCGCLQFLTG